MLLQFGGRYAGLFCVAVGLLVFPPLFYQMLTSDWTKGGKKDKAKKLAAKQAAKKKD